VGGVVYEFHLGSPESEVDVNGVGVFESEF
jgi:hypothetical protein